MGTVIATDADVGQTLAYAMKGGFDIPVDVSNQPKLKYVSFKTN